MKRAYSLSFKNNDYDYIIIDSNDSNFVKVEICHNSFPFSLNRVNKSTFISKHDDSAL